MCSFHRPPFAHSFDSPRTGFLAHLITYLAVNAGLLLINLLTAPEEIWAIWPMLGWGFGVLSHGLRLLKASDRSRTVPRSRSSTNEAPDWNRIEKRLQNLEAIVADEDLDAPLSPEDRASPSEPSIAR
jgi:hypothetical protein